MRCFILLTILCVVVVAKKRIPAVKLKQWERLIKHFKEECIEKSKADATLVDRMVYELEFPENLGLKRYWKCTHNHFGVIKGNGEIDGRGISKRIAFVLPRISLKCATEYNKIKNVNDKAFENAKCIINELAG
ncbi:hypothetical protein PPYR_01749 [Photinus pyralis]|uniref:Uncharacterized protein n=1 Tax=Photinus pyralis TaxID=7054 RepID=A0A5N4B584_PHOPY|nr:hypothetical protein PPYR_01749 [Photinus pyralis]